jgi:hypothetical protein
MNKKIEMKELTIQDHLDYMRKLPGPAIDRNLVILLNSLFKRLVLNEGVMSDDDLYRPHHNNTLAKIRKILKES